MTDETDMTVRVLQSVAGRAERQLRWAAFLTGALLLLLAIDVLLKRSIGRQMVQASDLVARAESSAHRTDVLIREVKDGRQRGKAGGPGGDAGPDADGGMAGNAGVAAGSRRAGLEEESTPGGRRGGPGGRPVSDARRAGGPEDGS